MANKDHPAGFRAVKHLSGGVIRLSRYHIASAYASNIFRGDAVIPTSTGKGINRPGSASARLIGVFDGCVFENQQGEVQYSRYWPANTVLKTGTVADAFVYDDPNILFEVQAAGSVTAGDIGALADPTYATAGNPMTGVSGDELDHTTIGTGGSVLKIIDWARRPDNELGTNVKLLVAISLHYLRGAMTTI